MNLRIINSKNGLEELLEDNQYVLDENQEYIAEHASSGFTKEDFKSIGTYISPGVGILLSTNKVGIVKLKDTFIRFRSKLGDDFFNRLKNEIAEIEKFLLLSSNSLEDHFSLTYTDFLDEIALSVFMEEWSKGRLRSLLRVIFESPSVGLVSRSISKNLAHGDVIAEIDFQYLNNNLNQLTIHKNRVLPVTFKSVIREDTNDVIEMRFVKFFLLFCTSLLERNLHSQANAVQQLEKNLEKSEQESSQKNAKYAEMIEAVQRAKKRYKEISDIKLTLNRYSKSEVIKKVVLRGDLDFTSLKLQNNFKYKFILEIFIKMRRTFDVLTNPNIVHLDINSLENLYEFYCYIKVIKSFDISPSDVRRVIKKTNSGWVIDRSKSIYLGTYDDVKWSLLFKRNYVAETETYSQDYEPDFSIELLDRFGNVSYLHLDAKYKHHNQGVKKEDIDKMHAYTHAIKSTLASIALFPGKKEIFYECADSIVGALPCSPGISLNIRDVLLKIVKSK